MGKYTITLVDKAYTKATDSYVTDSDDVAVCMHNILRILGFEHYIVEKL